jgi:aminoglycoside 3-N-acetyltransferase
MDTVTFTKSDIIHGFSKLGIVQGNSVLMHSSYKSLGQVEGGPDIVIDALLAAVGTSGNVMLPTFPFLGSHYQFVQTKPVFNVRTTPSNL